jgi:outer membrane receptor protein involved in Fe transport
VHDTLQLNGAAFYYDYKDKQLLGAIVDPVFGPLPKLINVPRSHIEGFELSADWMPIPGLSLSPAVTFVESRIDGCSAGPNCVGGQFYNFDPFNQYSNLTGEAFPSTPKWAGNLGASYEWPLKGLLMGFVGTNINYQSDTSGFFYDRTSALLPYNVLNIPARTLVDLRAGVENGRWTFQIWAHNVFDQYYWTGAAHVNDVLVHYTGMPRTYGISFSYKFF